MDGLQKEEVIVRIKAAKSLYECLLLTKSASKDDIVRRHKILARMLHPDRNADNARAADAFKAMQEAKEILSDDNTRDEYDRNYALGIHTTGRRANAQRAYRQPYQGFHFGGNGTGFMNEDDLFNFMHQEFFRQQTRRPRRPQTGLHDTNWSFLIPIVTVALFVLVGFIVLNFSRGSSSPTPAGVAQPYYRLFRTAYHTVPKIVEKTLIYVASENAMKPITAELRRHVLEATKGVVK